MCISVLYCVGVVDLFTRCVWLAADLTGFNPLGCVAYHGFRWLSLSVGIIWSISVPHFVLGISAYTLLLFVWHLSAFLSVFGGLIAIFRRLYASISVLCYVRFSVFCLLGGSICSGVSLDLVGGFSMASQCLCLLCLACLCLPVWS